MNPAATAPSNVLHATEHLSAGVLAFLTLATREMIRAGVQQTLVYSRRENTPADIATEFDPQVRLVEIDGPTQFGHLAFLRALRQTLRAELGSRHYDAVHLHAAKAGFVGRLALTGPPPRPPIFYSPHGLPSLNPLRPVIGALAAFMERVAGFSAFRPVGCGHGEALELERLTRRRVALLENPVDAAYFDVQRTPDAVPRVVTVGRACEQKGPTQFAELAARFHYAGERVQFVWVGAGDPEFEQVLRAVGVQVTGWVGQNEVRAQLARAHVYVQTSHWEGMPLSVLQAMAVGLPCVVTDVVGNRDAVAHGTVGLLAHDVSSLALHVKSLLDDPERARALGALARHEARRRFHPQQFRRALLSLYRLADESGTVTLPRPLVDSAAL